MGGGKEGEEGGDGGVGGRGSPHSPLLRRKGSAVFSISSALDALDLDHEKTMHLDVSSWLAGPS